MRQICRYWWIVVIGAGVPGWLLADGTYPKKSAAKTATSLASGRNGKPAAIPRNVDAIRPKKANGQETLPITAKAAVLGKTLTVEALEDVYAEELSAAGVEKASDRVSDDRFVRRVYLDVVGHLPTPVEIERYVKDAAPNKKAKLIDHLLADPRYGENWARYWRDVIVYRATGNRRALGAFDLVPWLAREINANTPWDRIVGAMLTASGPSSENPQGLLFGAHDGKPAEIAGETARIFLGIQIGCAECHDHPNDSWKRDQFHQLASFFGKVEVKRAKGKQADGIQIRENNRKVYYKPDLKHPERPGDPVGPVFLTGQPIPDGASDSQRRLALAGLLTSKRNPFFAKAFVNRVWAELIGYGFTNPVDDLSPKRPVVYPRLFDALSQGFAASNYDVKRLLRTVLNSRIYDRQFSELEGAYGSQALFRTITPTRLTADQIQEALAQVLGQPKERPLRAARGKMAKNAPRNLPGQFREVFGFDPSLDQGELEGSIPQALLLMNNPQLNQRINAHEPGTFLYDLVATDKDDRSAVQQLYLRVLARKPAAEELEVCLGHLQKSASRADGFEDLTWALINSTEFLHNQ